MSLKTPFPFIPFIMPKKKIDTRIRTLIENGVKTGHRSMFIIVGDKGRDQVVNLHYMLSKSAVKARPSVLWCYKKELGFSSHRKKRMKQVKKEIMKGLRDPDADNPFDLFISSTNVRYTYYRETEKILGNTYGMCVLQDFEALTPNLLARTIETVEGGGIIVFLLHTMSSLKQLYSISMDVHSRFRTDSHSEVVPRFNERFILTLADCNSCVAVDDELNILPITSHIRNVVAITKQPELADVKELADLSRSLADTEPAGKLVKLARTVDQAKAVLSFLEVIAEKTLRATVSLTASRGRGKSASMGIAVSGAIYSGYSNIFVTSPSPENLKAFWDFVFKGLTAMEYEEHTDYEIIQSTNPEHRNAVVRVNVFKEHRQTIQYIEPQEAEKLAQAELLVVDECAAIPLVLVRKLLGSYLVFLSSTINGYEGTGRSLSLKLIKQLRENSAKPMQGSQGIASNRVLHEVTLETPIRYSSGDPVESWLNKLLCLDVLSVEKPLSSGKSLPHHSECELFYVSRDALFSYHPAAEKFLQKIWALYVAAHYKNSPNDLQLLSDAPAHGVFVLLGPLSGGSSLPDVLCVIQVAFEGSLPQETIQENTSRGNRPNGDMIPWTLTQQFQDNSVAQLSGARIVRIATEPNVQKMGYGGRAIELLRAYFQGELYDFSQAEPEVVNSVQEDAKTGDSLTTETLAPRKHLPPLLQQLSKRKPERLHWMGVGFGLTLELFNFWSRCGYLPVYLRLSPNELTGEHSCIMMRTLQSDDMEVQAGSDWLLKFNEDFKRRYISLLSYQFRDLTPSLVLSMLATKDESKSLLSKPQLNSVFSPYDLLRLESYTKNLLDYHAIMDLLPRLSTMLFMGQLSKISLSRAQLAIFSCMGLQCRSLESTCSALRLPAGQVLALFSKACRKMSVLFREVSESSYADIIPRAVLGSSKIAEKMLKGKVEKSIADDLNEAAREELEKQRQEGLKAVKEMEIDSYVLPNVEDMEEKLGKMGSVPASVSLKRSKEEKKEKGEKRKKKKSKEKKSKKSKSK